MISNTLTASCNSVRVRSIRWSTFPATYRKTPSKRSWTTSLVLIIFSFLRIANRLWAQNGEDGGLCGGLFHTSHYIYQTLGSVATNALRELGLPCSQYINDRHLSKLWGSVAKRSSSLDAANAAFFVAATILTQLGYFLHLGKCIPVPTQHLIFLGHLVDSTRQTFSILEDKKEKFIVLRESMPSSKFVSLNKLQRFQGKCISLTLMVPSAQLHSCGCACYFTLSKTGNTHPSRWRFEKRNTSLALPWHVDRVRPVADWGT